MAGRDDEIAGTVDLGSADCTKKSDQNCRIEKEYLRKREWAHRACLSLSGHARVHRACLSRSARGRATWGKLAMAVAPRGGLVATAAGASRGSGPGGGSWPRCRRVESPGGEGGRGGDSGGRGGGDSGGRGGDSGGRGGGDSGGPGG
jgi:hypothetical protein